MLPPLVLEALQVRVGDPFAGPVVDGVRCRRGEHLLGHSAVEAHLVKLGLRGRRKQHVGRGVEDRSGEKHRLSVGREARRSLVGRVEGQPLGLAALGGHHEHVEVSVTVRGERDLRSVRRPDWHRVVGVAHGQGLGRPTRRRDLPEVAVVAENHGPAIRRNRGIAKPERRLRSRRRHGRREAHRREETKQCRSEATSRLDHRPSSGKVSPPGTGGP